MRSFIAVGSGAAVGAWIRWALSIALNPIFPTVPLGTLSANLIGGFLMGIALALVSHFEAMPPELRLLVTTGFLGGLTTFSTFSAEATTLMSKGQISWSVAMICGHVGGSLLCTFLGIALAEFLLPRR